MIRRLLPAAALALAAPASAETLVLPPLGGVAPEMRVQALPCVLTDDSTSCTRFLACIGDDGLWVNGRSFGRGRGVIEGAMSDGGRCNGVWSQDADGASSRVMCDGVGLIIARATYQEHYTGTTTGVGTTPDGREVEFWSGLHTETLLDPATGKRTGPLPCIPADALVS